MATGREDTGDWTVRGLIKKDFRQDHGGGPEEISRSPKRKSGKWCKGKEGREHEFEWSVYHSYWYGPPDDRREQKSYMWICKKCGKRDYMRRYRGVRENAKHKHIYSKTEVMEQFPGYSMVYEVCEICNRHGYGEFMKN